MDLGFNLAQSNRDLKDPSSRQNFGDTSGLLCKNDPILRLIHQILMIKKDDGGGQTSAISQLLPLTHPPMIGLLSLNCSISLQTFFGINYAHQTSSYKSGL